LSEQEKIPAGREVVAVAPKGSFALALGGGAARGLAHIVMLETLDDLGIRPRVIAGTSIGSLIGCCYASGMSGRDIKAYALELFEARTELVRRIFKRWPGSLSALFSLSTPAMVNAETLFEILLPESVGKTFDEMAIPFKVVATDFYSQEQVIFESGEIMPAVAASSALPALLTPVRHQGRILIDGGFVNPTPFDILRSEAQFTVAVDVTGTPKGSPDKIPSTLDTWIGAAQITLHSIVSEKLRNQAPDLFIRPDVSSFGVMDFYRLEEILTAAEPARDDLKRGIEELLASVD